MLKTLVALAMLVALCAPLAAGAAVRVHGYTRKNGTHVQSQYRSDPNATRRDNWTTRGNINPYTGALGHRAI